MRLVLFSFLLVPLMATNAMASCTYASGVSAQDYAINFPDAAIRPGSPVYTSGAYTVDSTTISALFGVSSTSSPLLTCDANEQIYIRAIGTIGSIGFESNVNGTYHWVNTAAGAWTLPNAGANTVTISPAVTNSIRLSDIFANTSPYYGIYINRRIHRAETIASGGGIVDGGRFLIFSTSDGQEFLTIVINPYTVTVPTCSINDYDQSVSLGKVSSSALNSIGSTANATDFNISMTCENVALTPSLTFEGSTDSTYVNVFSNQTGATYASGVGVSLTFDGNIVTPGQTVALSSGSTAMQNYTFSANYVRTGALSLGAIEIPVTFTMTYQ